MMNDDDDSTFESLAGATTKLLSKLEQFKENGGNANKPNADKDSGDKYQSAQRAEGERRRYLDHRIRELAAFEQRVNGQGFQRRTGRRMKK